MKGYMVMKVNKKDIIELVKTQRRIYKNMVFSNYGVGYPEQRDYEGWKLLGKSEALTLLLCDIEELDKK